jgi:hypothetical protein
LVVKQAKSGQGVSGHANKQAQIRMLPDAQSQQAKVGAFTICYTIGKSQNVLVNAIH